MKPLTLTLALLTAGVLRISAQITADIAVAQTGGPLGNITVELDHLNAPMATANFIGLASGKLAWIDSATGVVRRNTPYYDGIIFHRVIDGFMNQTGSQNGQGTDGPGYSFQDGVEVINGLDHSEPYALSMANSGPGTNGSQFFITVEPTPWLDGKHIVFGKVSATGNSRNVVNQINNLPTDSNDKPIDEVRIASITVNYNGVDFDPCAQGLPVVSTPALASPPTPSSTTLEFTQPANSTFHLSHSDDLADWTRITPPRDLGIEDTPLSSFPLPDGPDGAIGGPRRFYSPALIAYDPDFHFPTSIANQTLVANTNPTTQFTFVFNAAGTAAEFNYNNDLTGTATVIGSFTNSRFAGNLYLFMPAFVNPYWEFDDLNMRTSDPAGITGSHILRIRASSFTDPLASIPGTFTLTR